MKKYKLETIIFIMDAICMIVELVASRVLSPYFGSSNIVWTSVIGIILLSSSIGAYIGGKLADIYDGKNVLKIIIILTSISVLLIPFSEEYILNYISRYIKDVKLGAIITTFSLFFIPSLFIGTINPIVLKLKINDIKNTGGVAGKINAISTLGGIVGTFIGGFVLIPNIGSNNILYVITIIIVFLILLVEINRKIILFIIMMIVISSTSLITSIYINNYNRQKVLNNDSVGSVSYDTEYGRVLIYNQNTISGNNIRVLNIDSGWESASFTDNDKIYELVYEYTKYFDLMFKANIQINNTLLIGGAGYSYPKYYISHYLDKNMDVVEIDEDVTTLAKEYFYLDRLIDEFDLKNNHRLNLITQDGRVFLNTNSKKYDAILNDAYSKSSPARGLATIENIYNIKRSLNEGGVYLTNIISSLEGDNSRFLRAEVNTLRTVFKNVYVIPCNYSDDTYTVQNIIVFSTDDELELNGVYNLTLKYDEIILTDDYCPVDTLAIID